MGKRFTLAFAGDTSLGDSFVKQPDRERELRRLLDDPMSFFAKARVLTDDADYLMVNFESVLHSDNGHPPPEPIPDKPFAGIDDATRTLNVFEQLGVSAVAMANNHSIDYGVEQLIQSCEIFDQAGITPFGAGYNLIQAAKPYEFMLQGQATQKPVFVFNFMRAGANFRDKHDVFAGGTTPKDKSPGICGYERKTLEKAIKVVRKNVPEALIIVFPHRQGANYAWANSSVAKRYRGFIKAGADMVIGHGSRMLGQVERYRGGLIAYSLGAFVFNSPGRFGSTGMPPFGLVARLNIEEFIDGWQIQPEFYPLYIDNMTCEFTPYPVDNKQLEAIHELMKEHQLTGGDLPLKPIQTDRGWCLRSEAMFSKHRTI